MKRLETSKMKSFTVLYRTAKMKRLREAPSAFVCKARSLENAARQCLETQRPGTDIEYVAQTGFVAIAYQQYNK